MSTKILALDIDGVLNCSDNRRPGMTNRTYDLMPEKVKLLNEIIAATDCKIVLSSTWRQDFNCNWVGIDMFFEAVGIEPVCIGATPILRIARGYEIFHWIFKEQYILKRHTVTGLCILDDDDDMEMLKPWHVWTPNQVGLTEPTKQKAIDMLNEPFSLEVNLLINGRRTDSLWNTDPHI